MIIRRNGSNGASLLVRLPAFALMLVAVAIGFGMLTRVSRVFKQQTAIESNEGAIVTEEMYPAVPQITSWNFESGGFGLDGVWVSDDQLPSLVSNDDLLESARLVGLFCVPTNPHREFEGILTADAGWRLGMRADDGGWTVFELGESKPQIDSEQAEFPDLGVPVATLLDDAGGEQVLIFNVAAMRPAWLATMMTTSNRIKVGESGRSWTLIEDQEHKTVIAIALE